MASNTNNSTSIIYSKHGDRSQDEVSWDTIRSCIKVFVLQKILQPFTYIMQVPGKNFRTKLSRAFNYWLNIPDEKLRVIENIVQMLHNASLL